MVSEVHKMNHNTAPVRVFRVAFVSDCPSARLVNVGPIHSVILVIENVERGEFKCAGSLQLGASGDNDTFNALNNLRNRGFYGEAAEGPETPAGTIDGAVDQAEARTREELEYMYRWSREHPIGESQEKEPMAAPSKPTSDVGEPSPEEMLQMQEQTERQIREARDYAHGRRLEWKRVGRTPAGREYDVLTVDGVELLCPG